jgi:hypothetical protein
MTIINWLVRHEPSAQIAHWALVVDRRGLGWERGPWPEMLGDGGYCIDDSVACVCMIFLQHHLCVPIVDRCYFNRLVMTLCVFSFPFTFIYHVYYYSRSCD